jgi:hypothetical protein
MYRRSTRLAITVVVTLGLIVTSVYLKKDRRAHSIADYSEAIDAVSRSDERARQKELTRQEVLQRQIDHSAEVAMEIKDRASCYEATLAPVDIVKDESFSAAADSISAKIKQDDLILACMTTKGWPKK